MVISLRLSQTDSELFKQYAAMNGITVSDLIRQSLFSRIEDEYDLAAYKEAVKEYNANPKTYSLDEIEREILAK